MIAGLAATLSPAGARARLSVLIFHRVLPHADELMPSVPDIERFDRLLSWIGAWYRVLPLDHALLLMREGRLPDRAAAITFDDGYADNEEYALPVLRAHGMPATFFVATGFLDGGRMWNDSIIESIRRCLESSADFSALGLGRLPLGSADERRAAIESLLKHVKYQGTAQRERAVCTVHGACGRPALPDDLMMTSAQVLRLRDAGMQVGAHTRSHPILWGLPDPEARSEIQGGKRDLEELLGQSVVLFAYPNGVPGIDYQPKHVEMVREAGFVGAVTTAAGAAAMGHDLYQVPRFTPWDRTRLLFGARLLLNLRLRAAARRVADATP